uniref:Uncharacterized protein n=1 Tax=Moniliophthora roreri TaxID=221103 RepID=A0A0W0G747_MONRR
MAFIQGSSNFSISGGQLINIQGLQYVATIHDNRVVVHKNGKKNTIWDEVRFTIQASRCLSNCVVEYERIRTCDVRLTRVVANDTRWDVDRIFSIARIRGEDKEEEFLHVGYSGPGAFKAFKRDFAEFCAIRHPNSAQLFGYNDRRDIPALIFYDALIPLHRVFSGNFVLLLYIEFQLSVTKLVKDGRNIRSSELWIEPRSGKLRRGPHVQSDNIWGLLGLSNTPSTPPVPLSIQAYSDTSTIIDYLVRILSTDTILEHFSDRHLRKLGRCTAVEAWPCLAGSLWKKNRRDVIARWMGLAETTQYVCVRCSSSAMDEHKVVMEDGSVQLKFTNRTDFKDYWWLRYDLLHGNRPLDIWKPWLAQAHSVFSQLEIHEEEWEECSITHSFYLGFHRTERNTCQQVITDTPVYLFIRSIPCPSDNEAIWRSWAKSAKYFWSFDPFGREEMLDSTRASLGLPSYVTDVGLCYYSWDLDIYKGIERIHFFKAFDPRTTVLAHSLGYPLWQIVGRGGRFQDLEDSTNKPTIFESYDNDASEGSESDEEIVVYSRSNRAAVV